jgi:hypothetical protein
MGVFIACKVISPEKTEVGNYVWVNIWISIAILHIAVIPFVLDVEVGIIQN